MAAPPPPPRWPRSIAAFRGLQWDVLSAALAKRDAVALMATGSGKSLLYQFPTAHLRALSGRPSTTLVIQNRLL